MDKNPYEEKKFNFSASQCSGSALNSDQECIKCGFKCIEGSV